MLPVSGNTQLHTVSIQIKALTTLPVLFVFLFNFWRTSILLMGSLIPLFCTSGVIWPGFQSQGRSMSLACMLCHLHATVSSDSPLVWHLPISWQPARQLSYSDPHTCKQTLVELKSGIYLSCEFFFQFLVSQDKISKSEVIIWWIISLLTYIKT